MLSFEKWKKLNENLGNSGCLGLGQTKAVANLQSRWDEMGDIPMKSKKPFGDNGMGGLDVKKKPMGDDLGLGGEDDMDQDDQEHDMDGDDMSDENGDDMDDMDSDGEEGDGDSDDHLNGDEEGGEDAPLDIDPSLNKKKKPMAPPMDPSMGMGQPGMMKKRMKKESTKMSKTEREFWASLQDQAGGTSFVKNEDGDFVPVQEDAVFTPEEPNKEIQEPKAGELGFAPLGRIGGNFSEWAKKFK